MDSGNELAAPFFGFVVGTVLFGVTILQAYQYYLRYPADSILCKLKVAAVCLLDLLHLVLSVDLVYTFLISNFGVAEASEKNIWSVKALAIVQTVLTIFVQLIYLKRIYTLSTIPILSGRMFSKIMVGMISATIICLVGVTIVFFIQLQKIKIIMSFADKSEWAIYLGLGATAAIDVLIAGMMCIVLYKNKMGIGIDHISQQSDRILSNLVTYVVGTGLMTSFAAILEIVLYMARPNTLIYISVTFSATRLYTNSLLAMLNARKRLSARSGGDFDFKQPSGIVFDGTSAMRNRVRRQVGDSTSISISIPGGPMGHKRGFYTSAGPIPDSGFDHDVENQSENWGSNVDADVYSPYYSPLKARKRTRTLLPPKRDGYDQVGFWRTQRRSWDNGPVDRRSSL